MSVLLREPKALRASPSRWPGRGDMQNRDAFGMLRRVHVCVRRPRGLITIAKGSEAKRGETGWAQ